MGRVSGKWAMAAVFSGFLLSSHWAPSKGQVLSKCQALCRPSSSVVHNWGHSQSALIQDHSHRAWSLLPLRNTQDDFAVPRELLSLPFRSPVAARCHLHAAVYTPGRWALVAARTVAPPPSCEPRRLACGLFCFLNSGYTLFLFMAGIDLFI